MRMDQICDVASESDPIGSKLMIFPEKETYFTAAAMCERFGGLLHFELEKEGWEERIIPRTIQVKDMAIRNKTNSRCGWRIWVAVSDQEEEGQWKITGTNKIVEDYKKYFAPGQPNGIRNQNCGGLSTAIMDTTTTGTNHLDDGSCSESHCYLCRFHTFPLVKVKGLCKDQSIIDEQYTLVYSEEMQIPFFKGVGRSAIVKRESRWRL